MSARLVKGHLHLWVNSHFFPCWAALMYWYVQAIGYCFELAPNDHTGTLMGKLCTRAT